MHIQPADSDRTASLLADAPVVSAFMYKAPLHGQHILCPLLLNMDERPLPRAKGIVLDTRKRQHLVFGIHSGLYTYSISSTPSGISPTSIA